ncbi:hypothetical protein ACVW1A_000145 [Bradyrhizobium sp. LB1.3]
MVGDANIASFLNIARENEAEAMDHHDKYLAFLERVDQNFRNLMVAEAGDNVMARIMVLAAHAYFLSAVRTALGGQSPATFPNLRAAIECALYGLIMQEEHGADRAWLNRHMDRETCRRTFTAAKGIRLLKRDPNLRTLTQQVYDASIDFGAHPNPIAVMKNLRVEDVGDAFSVSLTSLHSVDSFPVEQALIACVETGAACVLIFSRVFPANSISEEVNCSTANLIAEFQTWLETEGFRWPLEDE